MKAKFYRDSEGRVDITLIAEDDVERVELKYFEETFRVSDCTSGNPHVGRYFTDAGGSKKDLGTEELVLRSYPEGDKMAELGVKFKLRFLNGVYSYFSGQKIRIGRRKKA